MSIQSYQQYANKLAEHTQEDRLRLIYEWVKTDRISVKSFKNLLEQHAILIKRDLDYDSFD